MENHNNINLNFLKNKKILITGATGIVGYNLCKFIYENVNCEIHVNFKNEIEGSFKNLFSNFIIHQFDINDINNIENLPEYDYVYYCSGYGQPKKFTIDCKKTFNLNTRSVSKLLTKVKQNGKFIFLSTSEIYVDSEDTKETSKITIDFNNPRNCYISGKLFGEIILNNNDSDIECKNIRLCLCYGPGFKNNDERVLSEFIFKGCESKEINLMDDGSDVRSYIYADDCIKAILNISNSGKYNTYNIGGKDLITIKNLADTVANITQSSVSINAKSNKLHGSPSKAFVNIDRYESEFGVLNHMNLEQGIQNCIDWHVNYKQ